MSRDSALRILLIEDNPADARLMLELLSEVDRSAFALSWANCLADGLKRLDAQSYELILLDLMLPDGTGLEAFEQVQARSPGIPVVVLSGREDRDLALSAVARGAEDYLLKGQLEPHTLVRSLCFAVERRRRNRAEWLLAGAQQQFRIARDVQLRLVPQGPLEVDGYDVAGAAYPAASIGGDYWDCFPAQRGEHVVVVGDVSGHGMGPALLMAETRAYLRALAEAERNPADILVRLNRFLVNDTAEDRFVSLFLAMLGPQGRVTYAAAGQRAYWLSAGGELKVLDSTGAVLGVTHDASFDAAPVLELAPGDLLLVPTDGMLEAESPEGRPFSVSETMTTLRNHRHDTAPAILSALYDAVSRHCAAAPFRDDVTLLVVKRTG